MEKKDRKNLLLLRIFQVIFVCSIVITAIFVITRRADDKELAKQQKDLVEEKKETVSYYQIPQEESVLQEKEEADSISTKESEILEEYQSLYQENSDLIGWITIQDTVIDYPVMQTMEDEDYYLTYDFYGQSNSNGSLIMDTDSNVGVGTKDREYAGGNAPSTNLIIHGHTMKSGQMFGLLNLYEDKEYGDAHSIICFDSLYEKREYQLIAAFYSQVYYKEQKVFKYYNFFQADTREEFQYWYENIKKLSLYDTGVSAEFGDEFITLSCCSYQVEDGRFVVVA